MALQTFLMLQLGVLALGLGAAMGWRGWQMRRQMTLLTESLSDPTLLEQESAATAETGAAVEPEPETDEATASEAAKAESEQPQIEIEAEMEAETESEIESKIEPAAREAEITSATNSDALEPSTEAGLDEEAQLDDDAASESSSSTDDENAEAVSNVDFDDLDELLAPPDEESESTPEVAASDSTEVEAAPPTLQASPEPVPEQSTESIEDPIEDTLEPEDNLDKEEPKPEENGLRALVTKFAAENRQLLEQVHTLEDEVARLEALQTLATPSDVVETVVVETDVVETEVAETEVADTSTSD